MNNLPELQMRRKICLGLLSYLRRECSGDERQPDAIKEYRRQLLSIRKKIRVLIEHKPSPVVIGLKTASLFGKVERS